MARQGHTNARSITIDQIEHTGRHASVVHDFGKQQCVERRDFAGLENHRATGGQCRRNLGGNLVERPVPGRDHRAHTDGLAHHAGPLAVFMKLERLQRTDSLFEVTHTSRHLRGGGDFHGRAHLLRDDAGHFFGAGQIHLNNFFQQRGTLGRRGLGKAGKRLARRFHRIIDIFGITQPDRGKRFAIGRVDDRQLLLACRLDPLPVDIGL